MLRHDTTDPLGGQRKCHQLRGPLRRYFETESEATDEAIAAVLRLEDEE